MVDTDNDGICDQDEITGCQDNTACNYDDTATNAGYCDYAEEGYDCDGVCLVDTDNDGICDAFETAGCADPAACNYDATSTDDDDSCTYAAAGVDCSGACLVDTDNDGICDQDEVTGCQDDTACNYDDTATNAGYCDYAEEGYDCDGNCANDADEDGICDHLEEVIDAACANILEQILTAIANGDYCGEGTVWIAEINECIAIPSCVADLDGDGNRGTSDLLALLSVFDSLCPVIEGCMDPEASNYYPLAEVDDGSCVY